MSAIVLRRALYRRRRRLTVMTVTLAVVAALALHHSDMVLGKTHDEHGMTAAVEMCLGVMTALGTAVMVIALGVLALGRWRPALRLLPVGLERLARSPLPRARAGPLLLSLLCVSRR